MTLLACLMVLAAPASVSEMKTIEVEGRTWEYVFARPAGKAKGLILAIHGAGGSGPQFDEGAAWSEKSTKAGFAVVCPSGLPSRMNAEANFATNPRVWNSGQLNERSPRSRVDDLKALDAIVSTCRKDVGEIPLFVSGHSNGAGMTFFVAYHWADRVAAIAPMSGAIQFPVEGRAKKPIPTLWFLGEKDPLTPFEGGKTTLAVWGGEKDNRPKMEELKEWAAWNGFQDYKESKAQGQVVFEYSGSFKMVNLIGHGHAWPGGKREGPAMERILGPNVATVDATVEALKFFEGHVK